MPIVHKPGWTTTEFWTTVLVHGLALVVTVYTLLGHTLNADHLAALIPAAALAASGIAQFAYSQSRAKTKVAASQTSVQASGVVVVGPVDTNAYTTHIDTVGNTAEAQPVTPIPPDAAQAAPSESADQPGASPLAGLEQLSA